MTLTDHSAPRRHAPPPIPPRLAHLPVHGSYAVPFITLRHRNGQVVLGSVSHDRVRAALLARTCQVCGRALPGPAVPAACTAPRPGDRIVVMARPIDLRRALISEPGMHPECAVYSNAACPMLAGALDAYRARRPRLLREPCGDPACECAAWQPEDPQAERAGQPADPWYAVWLEPASYRFAPDPDTGHLAVSLAGVDPLRIRPLPATGATADHARSAHARLGSLALLGALAR